MEANKRFWRFLQNQGIEIKHQIKDLKKQGYTKNQIINKLSSVFNEEKVNWDTNNF